MIRKTAEIRVGEQVVLTLRESCGQVAGKLTRLSADEGRVEIDGRVHYLTDFTENLSLKSTRKDLYLTVRRTR